jgi:hypothetical protein
LKVRLATEKSVEDLKAITDEKIIEAAHLQQSELFHVGKRQRSPIAGASDVEIEHVFEKLG